RPSLRQHGVEVRGRRGIGEGDAPEGVAVEAAVDRQREEVDQLVRLRAQQMRPQDMATALLHQDLVAGRLLVHTSARIPVAGLPEAYAQVEALLPRLILAQAH